MSGICDTCQRNQVCRKPIGGMDSCRLYVSGKESRYSRLFGTPERAARTIGHVCQFTHGGELCDRCQAYLFDSCDRMLRLGSEQKIYDALLEWLRVEGESE